MSERFAEAFVDKLILLEQAAGANVQYRVMPPFTAPFCDHLSIQGAAKDIAEFVELTGFTFVVAVAKQEEKVGGHIDLSTEGNTVFVEIDEDLMRFPDAVAAALCHEVCHKWLQVKHIVLPVEMENEILTDITSVFLGFGKIMLNGCKATNVRHEALVGGTRTITETKTSGYLDRDQLAFVYRLVCAMRNIPRPDAMDELNEDASQALRGCDMSFGHHYDERFRRPDATQEAVAGFNQHITGIQRPLSDLHKHVVYAKRSFLETISAFLASSHKDLASLRQKAAAMLTKDDPNPVLRYLKAIKNEHELKRMRDALGPMNNESAAFLKHAKAVGRHLSRVPRRFPLPSADMFSVVTCPQDGTKLRLPADSGDLIATCPTCQYRFAYNTETLAFPGPAPTPAAKPTLKTRLAKLFGRR